MPPTTTMRIDSELHRQLTSFAWHLGVTPSEVIAALVRTFSESVSCTAPSDAGTATLSYTPIHDHHTPEPVSIYAIYARHRIEAVFHSASHNVSIPDGPGAGTYRSPSGAAAAVVATLRPEVSNVRKGWLFWRISSNGEYLESLRDRSARRTSTGRWASQ